MKTLLVGAAFIGAILAAQPSYAVLQDCTITWAPNSEPDLAGYRVYAAPASKGYTMGKPLLDVPKTQTTAKCSALKLPSPSTYFFAVTAYDTTGNESGLSNEMSKVIGEEQTVPLAYVTRVQTDENGATVTISGFAVKLYVVSDRIPMQEVSGYVPGSATHRFDKRWAVGDTFVCFIAENSAGQKTEQGCNVPVIGQIVDTVAPSAPTLLEVK